MEDSLRSEGISIATNCRGAATIAWINGKLRIVGLILVLLRFGVF
jgi:hypothetical protein